MAAHKVEVNEAEVARIKGDLLRNPMTAHAAALQQAEHFKRANMPEREATHREAAAQLQAEGFAPTEFGDPGPGVKAYYQKGVLGPEPTSAPPFHPSDRAPGQPHLPTQPSGESTVPFEHGPHQGGVPPLTPQAEESEEEPLGKPHKAEPHNKTGHK